MARPTTGEAQGQGANQGSFHLPWLPTRLSRVSIWKLSRFACIAGRWLAGHSAHLHVLIMAVMFAWPIGPRVEPKWLRSRSRSKAPVRSRSRSRSLKAKTGVLITPSNGRT